VAYLRRLGMVRETGEHLLQQLLRLVHRADFRQRTRSKNIVINQLRMFGVILRKLAGNGEHRFVVLLPRGIHPKRRNSELTITIVQLVASKRGVAALPYWAVMPYVEKNYVVHRPIGEKPLRSELYAAMREEDSKRAYINDFCTIIRQESFANLPALSVLAM